MSSAVLSTNHRGRERYLAIYNTGVCSSWWFTLQLLIHVTWEILVGKQKLNNTIPLTHIYALNLHPETGSALDWKHSIIKLLYISSYVMFSPGFHAWFNLHRFVGARHHSHKHLAGLRVILSLQVFINTILYVHSQSCWLQPYSEYKIHRRHLGKLSISVNFPG